MNYGFYTDQNHKSVLITALDGRKFKTVEDAAIGAKTLFDRWDKISNLKSDSPEYWGGKCFILNGVFCTFGSELIIIPVYIIEY